MYMYDKLFKIDWLILTCLKMLHETFEYYFLFQIFGRNKGKFIKITRRLWSDMLQNRGTEPWSSVTLHKEPCTF